MSCDAVYSPLLPMRAGDTSAQSKQYSIIDVKIKNANNSIHTILCTPAAADAAESSCDAVYGPLLPMHAGDTSPLALNKDLHYQQKNNLQIMKNAYLQAPTCSSRCSRVLM